jgi:hypothetical protein
MGTTFARGSLLTIVGFGVVRFAFRVVSSLVTAAGAASIGGSDAVPLVPFFEFFAFAMSLLLETPGPGMFLH